MHATASYLSNRAGIEGLEGRARRYSRSVDLKSKLVLFLPLLVLALVSFVIIRTQQGEGVTLSARQQQAETLTPAKVAAVVRASPDPATNRPGRSAVCAPLGSGELHNPWRCTISYSPVFAIQYMITLDASGAFTGDQEIVHDNGTTYSGPGQVRGCCVVIP